ncbi:hypothetical protein P354_16580 [Streptomyces noursei PD-1]|nr:hypothetical protein P354_16580 [Streptomyces noursei PD-1]
MSGARGVTRRRRRDAPSPPTGAGPTGPGTPRTADRAAGRRAGRSPASSPGTSRSGGRGRRRHRRSCGCWRVGPVRRP